MMKPLFALIVLVCASLNFAYAQSANPNQIAGLNCDAWEAFGVAAYEARHQGVPMNVLKERVIKVTAESNSPAIQRQILLITIDGAWEANNVNDLIISIRRGCANHD